MMKLTTLAQGEPWMTDGEATRAHQFVSGVTELLQARGVAENPLLVLRVNDVLVSWLLTRRLENGLAPDDANPDTTATTPAQADAIGKSRERLRKAIKDLEDYCARAGTPVDTGLSDQMQPVIQHIQGPGPFPVPR